MTYIRSVFIAIFERFIENYYKGYRDYNLKRIEVLDVKLPVKSHDLKIIILHDAEDKSYMNPEQHFYTSKCTICPNKPQRSCNPPLDSNPLGQVLPFM